MTHIIYYTCKFRYGFRRIESDTREQAKEIGKKTIPGTGTWCQKRCDNCKFKILE